VTAKDQSHQAVDPPTNGEARAAIRAHAIAFGDPVAGMLAHAPIDDEPETEQERGAVMEAKLELAGGGRTISLEQVKHELGLA
jgi:hypothetical protein